MKTYKLFSLCVLFFVGIGFAVWTTPASGQAAKDSATVQKEMETLMQGYFTYLLERELNTPGFIRDIGRQEEEGGK